jgi:hypothetical protein
MDGRSILFLSLESLSTNSAKQFHKKSRVNNRYGYVPTLAKPIGVILLSVCGLESVAVGANFIDPFVAVRWRIMIGRQVIDVTDERETGLCSCINCNVHQ